MGFQAFPTTHWSLVGNAAHADAAVKRKAVVELLMRYMPPLKSHLIARKRIDPHRADDLMQGFLASKVLEQDLIGRAQRERGKFRTFLLTALDHFVISQARHDRAAKRAANPEGALPEDDLQPAQSDPGPAEQFDIAWARQVLAQAIDRMREECGASDRPDLWGVFEHRIQNRWNMKRWSSASASRRRPRRRTC
jgi:DNA-directed RNA polymerase specialized sigma24 family protein